MKKHKKYRNKKKILTNEKRIERLHYRIVISLMVLWVVHYLFFDRSTIGGDDRYLIYIFWTPVLLGMLTLGVYRKSFLIKNIVKKESFVAKLIGLGFILIQGFFISYLSFGLLAHGIWNQINIKKGEDTFSEIKECTIESFHFSKGRKSKDKIWFYFSGELESIRVRYKDIKKYINKEPEDFTLVLELKKGMWEHYSINNWNIKKKNNRINSE